MKRRHFNPNWDHTLYKKCQECGDTFSTTYRWTKYCTDQCACLGKRKSKAKRTRTQPQHDAKRNANAKRKAYQNRYSKTPAQKAKSAARSKAYRARTASRTSTVNI